MSPFLKPDALQDSPSRTVFELQAASLSALPLSSMRMVAVLILSRRLALAVVSSPMAIVLAKPLRHALPAMSSTREYAPTSQSRDVLLDPASMALLVSRRSPRPVSQASSTARSVKTSRLAFLDSTSKGEFASPKAEHPALAEPTSSLIRLVESRPAVRRTLTSTETPASSLLTMRMTVLLALTMTRAAVELVPLRSPAALPVESGTERLALFSLFLSAVLGSTPTDDASSLRALVAALVPFSTERTVFSRTVRLALPEVFSAARSVSLALLPSVKNLATL